MIRFRLTSPSLTRFRLEYAHQRRRIRVPVPGTTDHDVQSGTEKNAQAHNGEEEEGQNQPVSKRNQEFDSRGHEQRCKLNF